MKKKIRPIPIEEFPNVNTNCLGFAIGSTKNINGINYFSLNHNFTIDEAFIKKIKSLGYTNIPRRIENLEEAKPNEYVFKVIGFKEKKDYFDSILELKACRKIFDFHVLRRELDGTWVHKPGWFNPPCSICEEDWAWIYESFGKKFVLFALAAEEKE